jgi:hypothetical protein
MSELRLQWIARTAAVVFVAAAVLYLLGSAVLTVFN